MLFIFSGLPASGKSTIAKKLAQKISSVYLQVDTIEQVLRANNSSSKEIGPEGYFVLYELAQENLKLGANVITDSVNDLRLIRNRYRDIAMSLHCPYIEIEVCCSDVQQHQNRVKERITDIPGLISPTWESIINHPYESWDRERLILDTSTLSPDQSVEKILSKIPHSIVP